MKSFLVLIILMFLTACINTRYYYYPENYKDNNISVSGNLVEFNNQNSPLNDIWILDLRDNYNEKHKAKILSSTIKINSNGKEYTINTKPDSDHIYIYKQGIIITGDFTAYIGKVQLDDGTIIDIPPLSFKKNVYVESYNPVTDTINAGARTKRLFNGTVEDYKKQKK